MIAGPPLWQLGADMYLPLTFLTVWLQARVAVHGLLPAATRASDAADLRYISLSLADPLPAPDAPLRCTR